MLDVSPDALAAGVGALYGPQQHNSPGVPHLPRQACLVNCLCAAHDRSD